MWVGAFKNFMVLGYDPKKRLFRRLVSKVVLSIDIVMQL